MEYLLKFIIRHFMWLFESYGFQFAASSNEVESAARAAVLLKSEHLQIQFVHEYHVVTIELARPGKLKEAEMFPLSAVCRYLAEERQLPVGSGQEVFNFARNNFPDIQKFFSERSSSELIKVLTRV